MAITTGASLYSDFYEIAGAQYTGYLSPVQVSELFERSFVQVMYNLFVSGKQDSTNKDRLNSLVNTNQVLSLINNNQFYVEPLQIINVVNTSGTTWVVTTYLAHNILATQSFVINGVAGFITNPNTTFGAPYTATSVTANTITFTATASGGGSYTANTGSLVLINGQIYYESADTNMFTVDYWRFLAIKAKYVIPLYANQSVVKYSYIKPSILTMTGNALPIVINMNFYSNLRTGDQISISGVTGNTSANGTFFIKKLNDVQIALFLDKYFQTAVVGNGSYNSGTGSISRVYYIYCTPYLSDEKINTLNTPNAANPKYEVANNMIKLYPTDFSVQEITMDYVRKPYNLYASGYAIDANDTVVNLELYYPKDFLTMIASQAANIFLSELRDGNGLNLTEITGQK